MKKATFGAGCFWGVESTFQQLTGVKETAVGYEGGATLDPNYNEVCTDTTGHAEVVELAFDPELITYEKLLEVFWSAHNPTTLNRQGPDMGSQYRSVIFYHDEEQKATATASKEALQASGKHSNDVVTEITEATTFYKAEEYHQQYLEKRGQSSCHFGG